MLLIMLNTWCGYCCPLTTSNFNLHFRFDHTSLNGKDLLLLTNRFPLIYQIVVIDKSYKQVSLFLKLIHACNYLNRISVGFPIRIHA